MRSNTCTCWPHPRYPQIILHKLTCKHSPAPKRKPSGRGDKPASVRPEAYKTTDNAAACEQPDASTDPAAALAKAPPCSELLDTVTIGATVSGGDKLVALAPASENQLPCPLPVHMQQRHLASHPSSKRVRKMSIDNTPPLVKLLHEQPSDEVRRTGAARQGAAGQARQGTGARGDRARGGQGRGREIKREGHQAGGRPGGVKTGRSNTD